MANDGTSNSVVIRGEEFTLLKSFKISNVINSDVVASPPVISSNSDIFPLVAYVNKHKNFTFSKIAPPLYGDDKSVARYTGLPAN